MLLCAMFLSGCNGGTAMTSPDGSAEASQDPCDAPGTICTVAGTGFSLFDGDGKSALETSLYYPLDVSFDEEHRALLLDWNNLRVRRINHDGTIETIMGTDFEAGPIAGAMAIDTGLHHASDIEMDDQDRLYSISLDPTFSLQEAQGKVMLP